MPRVVVGLFSLLFGLLAVACLVYGIASGLWMGGLFYSAIFSAVIWRWHALRRVGEESRAAADEMIGFVFLLAISTAQRVFGYLGL